MMHLQLLMINLKSAILMFTRFLTFDWRLNQTFYPNQALYDFNPIL